MRLHRTGAGPMRALDSLPRFLAAPGEGLPLRFGSTDPLETGQRSGPHLSPTDPPFRRRRFRPRGSGFSHSLLLLKVLDRPGRRARLLRDHARSGKTQKDEREHGGNLQSEHLPPFRNAMLTAQQGDP